MREVLFRGKRTDNGEWVDGNLFVPDRADAPTEICIGTNIVRITFDVIPETVCQYTGVTDVNGSKIFEGDVVEVYCATGELRSSGSVVHWDDFFSGWYADEHLLYGHRSVASFKVVGNIHDNPELLEGGAE